MDGYGVNFVFLCRKKTSMETKYNVWHVLCRWSTFWWTCPLQRRCSRSTRSRSTINVNHSLLRIVILMDNCRTLTRLAAICLVGLRRSSSKLFLTSTCWSISIKWTCCLYDSIWDRFWRRCAPRIPTKQRTLKAKKYGSYLNHLFKPAPQAAGWLTN